MAVIVRAYDNRSERRRLAEHDGRELTTDECRMLLGDVMSRIKVMP